MNCLQHLHICNAECCKEFRLKIPPRTTGLRQGTIIGFNIENTDQELYYTLRGFLVTNNKVIITLKNFKKKNEYLYIYSPCKLLTSDNKCQEHNTGRRPKICDYPNKNGGTEGIYFTTNCIYKP